ncbi:hypothetical protein Tsubulata_047784 [Turnera subulata]|uniref:Uncharacterized protein n=1 Tax=Turnera subulata TaxID=218843 RepID=A0A9Q0G0Y5_9ROSI|nr:hypothetical protein Tsubulata_047784 [Turnera subulata]
MSSKIPAIAGCSIRSRHVSWRGQARRPSGNGSQVNTKKGKSPSGGGDDDGACVFSRQDQEKFRLYEDCINAPTPVRFLKPRKQSPDQGEGDPQERQEAGHGHPRHVVAHGHLGLVDIDKVPKYELTEEDGKRLAKEYSRVLMRRQRVRQAAESGLLQLKKEAIEALPEKLRAVALVLDLTSFPKARFMATLMPPIEGYIDEINAAMKGIGKENANRD